ncbi:MAG TPA: metal-dependent hydrolase [Candidatus Limnocylindrales bacterium]|jgi:L-ascorbate metabolism protein UlaG (beta-lactamase superfamily)|nr:metal-dependent hydrolase [Candidatus Limnocylindrales bacterium]
MKLNGIKLTWLGHATFHIETPAGKKILIDPWVMNNPATPADKKKFDDIDVMLCTHGHGDHIGDAVELVKRHNPRVVGVYELCLWMNKKGAQQIMPMNKGGSQEVGDIYVTMVHADHSCGIEDDGQIIYGGEPCGYVIQFQNGLKIYHAGDTNVFGDMRIIHELYQPDLVMLPIGDVFTMGPREASYACKLLNPKAVIPMHFGTFPLLTGTPKELERRIQDMGIELHTMKPGETLS